MFLSLDVFVRWIGPGQNHEFFFLEHIASYCMLVDSGTLCWTTKLSFLFSFSSANIYVNVLVISDSAGILFVDIDPFPSNSIAFPAMTFVCCPTEIYITNRFDP